MVATAGGFVTLERGAFIPLKNGFCKVEAAFTAVTASSTGTWYNGGGYGGWDVEKEIDDDGDGYLEPNIVADRERIV